VNDEIVAGAPADAAEAIQIILDTLHEQVARPVNMEIHGNTAVAEYIDSLAKWKESFCQKYSPIVENYYGQTQSSVTCQQCGTISRRYEPWSIYKLPIPATPTLADAFAASVTPEELEDYDCTVCKSRTRATIQTALSRLPNYMFVFLKRFTVLRQKVHGTISYDPDHISLEPYCCAWAKRNSSYRVVATVEHLGGTRGGHYCMRSRVGDKWIVLDDAQIGEAGHGQGMPDTYVLVLERLKSE
jgi:ubiquitin C-terminal hydrolase